MAQQSSRNLFTRMHLSFVDTGVMRAIHREVGIGGTIALIVIARHMDEKGVAFPSQERMAELAGVSVRSMGEWIRGLERFRWHGQPILKVAKRTNGQGKAYNVYQLLPASQWAIFEGGVYED